MKDSYLKHFNKIIIAIFLVLVIVAIYFNRAEIFDLGKSPIPTETGGSLGVPKLNQPSVPLAELPVSPAKRTAIYKRSIGFNPGRYDHVMKQKKLVREFKNLVKLEVMLPSNIEFVNVEMDDGVAAIYGSNLGQDKQLAVFAARGKIKLSQAVDYLEESQKGIPILEKRKFLVDQVQTIKAPESSGLGDLQVIPTTEKDGKAAYGALVERKDGKGTYLFLMEASADYFENQEESLEKMLQSAKASP